MRSRVLPGLIKLLLIAVFTGLITCAPDEICFTENGTRVKIDFRRIIYPDTDSAFEENDTLIVFQVSAADTDSIFVGLDTLSSVILPVNTGADATTFVFDTELGNHTFELKYERTQRLISVECGPEQIIDNLSPGATTFDSVSVVLPTLVEQLQTNVEIYR